jgi:hypothetical protein
VPTAQPHERRNTLRDLQLFAEDVRTTGQANLIRLVDQALQGMPGHQDEPLSELVTVLTGRQTMPFALS